MATITTTTQTHDPVLTHVDKRILYAGILASAALWPIHARNNQANESSVGAKVAWQFQEHLAEKKERNTRNTTENNVT